MARNIRIKLQDSEGNTYHWTVRHVPRAVNCHISHNRIIHGWEFESHDGCTRFAEGNWNDLVSLFRTVADNYGLTSNLS